MILNIFLLIIGFIMLVRGADYFVDGAVALAQRLRIPAIVIGLTVVAIGTSAPEAAISILSVLKDSDAILIGNIIGSNIANILLILGVTVLISDLHIQKNTFVYEIPFVGFITLLLYGVGLYYGIISRLFAFVLLGLFVRTTELTKSKLCHVRKSETTGHSISTHWYSWRHRYSHDGYSYSY